MTNHMYVHVHTTIKCGGCGCEYCAGCFALQGCPQCGKGKAVVTTSSTGSPDNVDVYIEPISQTFEERFDEKFNHFNEFSGKYKGDLTHKDFTADGKNICDYCCENSYDLEDVKDLFRQELKDILIELTVDLEMARDEDKAYIDIALDRMERLKKEYGL